MSHRSEDWLARNLSRNQLAYLVHTFVQTSDLEEYLKRIGK